MFEVTIRTDNHAALLKLIEVLSSLDVKLFKDEGSNEKELASKFIVELPKKQPSNEDPLVEEKTVFGKGWSKGPIPLPPNFNKSLEKFKPGFGGAKGMIALSPDWDEPLDDFKEYM